MFYGTGINKYNVDKKFGTIHAEVDAALKCPYQKKKKKVDIFVGRISKDGDKFLLAKPCCNCVKSLNYILKKKNYKINRIYYTEQNGNVSFLKK